MPYLDSSDGLVDIKCGICGEFISRGSYMGFTTATCVGCQNAPVEEESIPLELRTSVEAPSYIMQAVEVVKETVIKTTKKVKEKWTQQKKKKEPLQAKAQKPTLTEAPKKQGPQIKLKKGM